MGRQTFASSDVAEFPPASNTAVTASATRTNLWVPSIWTPISAFDLKPGRSWILRCGGVFTTTGTQGTIIFNPTFGQSSTPASNIALGASSTLTWTASLTGVSWWAELVVGIRQIGIAAAGSTITGTGYVVLSGASTAVSQTVIMGGTVPTTADHTTAQGLALDVTLSAASQSITCQWTSLQNLS
jgi:hypothetical protein